MKKIMITFMAILILLCGCQANGNTNVSDYGNAISKAQEITVIVPETAEVIDTITDTAEIKDFVSALEVDKWKIETLPDEASEIGSFGIKQEKTIKLGQKDTDGTLYDVATIILYNGDYISTKIDGFEATFEVSEETADYLKEYFE